MKMYPQKLHTAPLMCSTFGPSVYFLDGQTGQKEVRTGATTNRKAEGKKKWELLHKRIKTRNAERDCLSTRQSQWFGKQRVALGGGGGGGGMWIGGKKGPRTALFVGFSRHGPCGSWRLWGRAAYSPCSPRQNAAQEDRKEAGLFFMDALSVCLTARLKQSNSTVRQREREEVQGGERERETCATSITTVHNMKRKTWKQIFSCLCTNASIPFCGRNTHFSVKRKCVTAAEVWRSRAE